MNFHTSLHSLIFTGRCCCQQRTTATSWGELTDLIVVKNDNPISELAKSILLFVWIWKDFCSNIDVRP